MERIELLEEIITSLVLPNPAPVWSPLFFEEYWSRELDSYRIKFEELAQKWSAKANSEWASVFIDLVCYPATEEEWVLLRERQVALSPYYEDNDLDEDLTLLLARWGSFNPNLIVPQLGRLLRNSECREKALGVFAYTKSDQIIPWLKEILEDVYSMSGLELNFFIAALNKTGSDDAINLLLRLKNNFPPGQQANMEYLDRALGLRNLN